MAVSTSVKVTEVGCILAYKEGSKGSIDLNFVAKTVAGKVLIVKVPKVRVVITIALGDNSVMVCVVAGYFASTQASKEAS